MDTILIPIPALRALLAVEERERLLGVLDDLLTRATQPQYNCTATDATPGDMVMWAVSLEPGGHIRRILCIG